MTSFKRRLAVTCFTSALVLGGCKSAPTPAAGVRNSDGSVTNADGSITYPAGSAPAAAVSQPAPAAPAATPKRNPDGSLTNPDGSVTYPAGSAPARHEQQPTAAPPVAQASRPAPVVREAPVARVIPSGTPVRITITETLSASHNEAGDAFSGVLAAPLTANGGTAFQRGAAVRGTVIGSKRKGHFKGAGDLAIEITSIGGAHVRTTEYNAIAKGKGKRTGALVGGGAGLGALIGGLAGGGKGALIGGLAGAGAGTAGAAYTGSRDVIIPSETTLTFNLTEPLTVR